MKIEIKHRYTDNVLYSCEAENMREAVLSAIKETADLSYADLSYADLSYADLSYADLRFADLSFADLSFADLSFADLRSADLSSANLHSTNLRYADLRYADLSSADLSSADLRFADLYSANLGGEILAISPLYVTGLYWKITITESLLTIGCKRYKHKEWAKFSDDEIADMDSNAAQFWTANKSWLLSACKSHRKESLSFRKANPVEVKS